MRGARQLVAGGTLSELFAVDLTTATATCGHRGGTAALAAHDVYADAPALVGAAGGAPASSCASPPTPARCAST